MRLTALRLSVLSLLASLALLVGCASSGGYSAARSIDGDGGGQRRIPDAPASGGSSALPGPNDPINSSEGGGSGTVSTPDGDAPDAGATGSDGAGAGEASPTVLTREIEAEIRRLARFITPDNVDDPTPDAVQAAAFATKRLREIGPIAVPVLETATTEKNAIDLATVIVRIRQQAAKDGVAVPAGPSTVQGQGEPVARPDPAVDPSGVVPLPLVPDEVDPDADALSAAGIANLTEREFIRRLVGDTVNPVTASEEAAVGRFVWRKLREMEELAGRLDYASAIRIGEAVLTLLPGSRFARQIRTRLHDFHGRQLQMKLLDGRIVALPTEVRYGDTITFRLTVRNVSDRKLTIAFTSVEYRSRMEQDVYTSPAMLRVKFTQYVDPSTPVSNTRNEPLKARGDVMLDPGQVWSMDWSLDTGSAGTQVRAIGEYEVSGWIRPLSVTSVNGNESIRIIHCEPATARVLPAGYESARENPLRSLEAAFRIHDPVGAVLAASAAREAALSGSDLSAINRVVAWLLSRLSEPRRTRQLAFQALRAATGLGFGFDERHWRMWYQGNADTPGLGLDRPNTGELDIEEEEEDEPANGGDEPGSEPGDEDDGFTPRPARPNDGGDER